MNATERETQTGGWVTNTPKAPHDVELRDHFDSDERSSAYYWQWRSQFVEGRPTVENGIVHGDTSVLSV